MSRLTVALLVCAITLAACSSGGTTSATTGGNYSAQVGSTDLYAKAPQRFQIGVFRSSDQGVQLLTSGTIDIQITPFQGGPGTPLQGKGHYVGAPGTGADTGTPELTDPSTARGVYEFDGTFDAAGVWQADVGFQVDGSPVSLSTEFQVLGKPELPAPGQRAFRTENLTVTSHVNPQSVDSRAQAGASIPDRDLHTYTIAGAIAAHRAALVLFATPVYCRSQFCGPSVDSLQQMATTGPRNVDYIHIEIFKDYEKNQVNAAAQQWVIRPNAASDPWLFLIAPNGMIADRWGPLFDPSQVMTELRRVAG